MFDIKWYNIALFTTTWLDNTWNNFNSFNITIFWVIPTIYQNIDDI